MASVCSILHYCFIYVSINLHSTLTNLKKTSIDPNSNFELYSNLILSNPKSQPLAQTINVHRVIEKNICFECCIGSVRPLNNKSGQLGKQIKGTVDRIACELFDANNRLVRTIFCLCSAPVSNNSSDKLTDTTKLDGSHKIIRSQKVVLFFVFL